MFFVFTLGSLVLLLASAPRMSVSTLKLLVFVEVTMVVSLMQLFSQTSSSYTAGMKIIGVVVVMVMGSVVGLASLVFSVTQSGKEIFNLNFSEL